jgi:hypothetical protein
VIIYIERGKVMEKSQTAFEHTMDAMDRCHAKGYGFDVWISSMLHDAGKATTPRDILPKHHGHEIRSREIAIKWLAEHKFTHHINKLVPVACAEHMLAHNLNILKVTTLVRWYKRIRTHIPQIIQVFNCDHELNAVQIEILERLHRAFKEAVIEIPVTVQKKGREAIVQFVENIYAKSYKGLK